ncbi:MAG: histidine phosphatase family protein [Hylemonella sp.]
MTELILIRHGETDWNRELRFQGQLDVPLNATGLLQAQRLAERLARETVHRVISSDLQRAYQTALALAQEPVLQPALREQHFGVAEGLGAAELRQRHPQAWQAWLRFDPDFAFEGGESTRLFHARVLQAVQTLAWQHEGQRLAVVTHGGVLDMIWRTALRRPLAGPREADIPNAGLNRVRVHAAGIDILEWADTRHLADLPPQPVYDQQRLVRERDAPAGLA